MRQMGGATVPAPLGLERATNPFLRVPDPGFKARLGLADLPDAEVFAEVRRRKDAFRAARAAARAPACAATFFCALFYRAAA